MRTWILVKGGKAHWKFTSNDPAATFAEEDPSARFPGETVPEVTGQSPMPAEGWTYVSGTTFEAPAAISWDVARADRDGRLVASDWTQLADSPLDAAGKAAWATYRQTLRDIPQTYATTPEIVWPAEPA